MVELGLESRVDLICTGATATKSFKAAPKKTGFSTMTFSGGISTSECQISATLRGDNLTLVVLGLDIRNDHLVPGQRGLNGTRNAIGLKVVRLFLEIHRGKQNCPAS